jgi:hypothetical protein
VSRWLASFGEEIYTDFFNGVWISRPFQLSYKLV